MILRALPTAVCLLAALSICTTAFPAWTADHDANSCAAGGGGGGSGGGGSGGGGGGGSGGGGGAGGSGGGGSSGGSGSGASGGSGGSAGGAAAASSAVGAVGPAASSVDPAHNGGVGLRGGAMIGDVGNGGDGGNVGIGIDTGGDPSGATSLQGTLRPYSLRAIYFRRDQFKNKADCLTAAYTQRLPLEVCQ